MGVVEILIKAKDLTAGAFATTKAKLTALKAKVATTQGSFGSLGGKIMSVMSAAIMPIMLVVAAVYAIGKAVGSVTGQFGEFESAMKGVQKTTGMSDEEVALLGDDFKELSRDVPKSATELAKIGKIAGQLGIEGGENIRSFTETVAEASVAFDMDAEAAAYGLAALQKIYGTTIPEIVNLGSAVNELGNTTGASEAQLLEFSTQLGPTAEMLGFTSTEALGMGATLIELKMNASDAGTRLNSAFTIMGQKIPQVSEFLGMSEEAFRDAFGDAPLEMVIRVIDEIAKIEDPLEKNTQATALFGRIGAKAIKGLTKDTDRLRENVDKATAAYKEGTAMHEEYLIFASSFEAKMELVKNKVNLAAIAIGEALAPAILALGNALTDIVLPALGDLATEIAKQTDEAWPNFKNAVVEALGKIVGDTNLVTWSGIMTGVGTVIGTAMAAILTGLELIIEANGPFLTAIGGMVTCITEFISDIQNLSIKEAFTNLGKNIFTALGNIKDEIAGKVSPIVDAISSGLGKVKAKVGPIFEEVKTAIFTKLGSIKEGIGEVLNPVKTAIHNKLVAIKDGLAEKLAPITTIVLNALSNIKDKLDPIIAPIKTAIHTKLGDIKKGLAEKLAPVKTAIEGVFTSAVGVIKTSFADLPTAIGTIFTTIGKAITTFGENLPGFLGTSVADLGKSFTDIGDSFTIPTEDIETDLGKVTEFIDTTGAAVGIMKEEWEKIPLVVETIAEATGTMQTEVEKDVDKITIDVDGVKVTFDGLKGKIGDVVKEFGNFEDIAGDLIGLDWAVFTTLREELPKIDKGIGEMKKAFGELKTVLDKNIGNFETIQKDLGSIEEFITPFVNNIAPGIKAIGDFGKALSDTQSALGIFASMSEIDIKGMLGFESAVHSMVMGLGILEGQIERLMPSFSDIKSVITRIANTFAFSGGRAEIMAEKLRDAAGAMNETGISTEELWVRQEHLVESLMDMGVSGEVAYEFWHRLRDEQGKTTETIGEFLNREDVLSHQLSVTTGELKIQTGELTKISDAIQPLINFMGTLNKLYESVFGEKAAVWDAIKVQEVFAAIEDTIGFMGKALGEVDFGKFIGEALDNSEDFRNAMVEDGSQLNILTNYIDILLGNYVDLAELMARLTEAEEDLGDETFEVSQAFAGISEYVQGLGTYLPTLTTELGALNDLWGESGETIAESMTSYHKLVGVVQAISVSFADFTNTMLELSMAQMTASELGINLGRSLEMVVEFVTELSNIVPTLAKELNTLDDIWVKNQETVNKGAMAFEKAMEPIQIISDGMLNFSDVMAIAGDDIGAKFDSITDYIDKLTVFTPILGKALGGLKTVWDENSGAIEGGVTAFTNIVTAITDVQTSIGDLVTAEGDLQTAANDATTAVDTEADALAGHSLSTSLDTTTTASVLLQAATAALAGVITPFTGTVSTAATTLSGVLVSALEAAASAMANFTMAVNALAGTLSGTLVGALGAAANAMASLAGGAYSSGSSIAHSFAAGIRSGIGAVESAASALAAVVASYLGAHSNTELGALSDLESWGPAIVRTVEEGMRGKMVSLSKTLNDISLGGVAISGATGSGSGNSTKKVYITINQKINSRTDADYAIREVERLMKKPQII